MLLRKGSEDEVVAARDEPGEGSPDPHLGRVIGGGGNPTAPQPPCQQDAEYVVADEHGCIRQRRSRSTVEKLAESTREGREHRECLADTNRAQVVGLADQLHAARLHSRPTDSEQLGVWNTPRESARDPGPSHISRNLTRRDEEPHRSPLRSISFSTIVGE